MLIANRIGLQTVTFKSMFISHHLPYFPILQIPASELGILDCQYCKTYVHRKFGVHGSIILNNWLASHDQYYPLRKTDFFFLPPS